MPEHPHPLKKLPKLPSSFAAYHCETCDKTYEWWQLPCGDVTTPMYALGEEIENVARAKALESFPHEQIWLKQLHRRMQTIKPDATIEQTSNVLNKIYNDFNKKGIKMVRCQGTPQQYERQFDEKFQCIEFAQSVTFSDLFNRRAVKQWDFKFVGPIDEIREKVNQNDEIRYKERWIAAIDFFKRERTNTLI